MKHFSILQCLISFHQTDTDQLNLILPILMTEVDFLSLHSSSYPCNYFIMKTTKIHVFEKVPNFKIEKKFCEQVIHISIPSCHFYVLSTPIGNDWIYSLEYDVIQGFLVALMWFSTFYLILSVNWKKKSNVNVYWFSLKTLESPPFELYEDLKGVLLFSFRFHLALIIVCCFSPLARIIWTFFFSLKGNNLTLKKTNYNDMFIFFLRLPMPVG